MARIIFVLIVFLLSGCGKNAIESPTPIAGQAGSDASFLAYEHTVSVSAESSLVSISMSDVRLACTDQRFGTCSLLQFEESTGKPPSGSITVRLAPEAVEPLIALAGKDSEINSYRTRAEDLSAVAEDIAQQREQLQTQQSTLRGYQERKDVTAGDLIALSSELSKIAVRLTEIEKSSETVSRRVETNLLTVKYSSKSDQSASGRISGAVVNSTESFVDGFVEAIDLIAFGIPYVFVAFPLALVWRWAWRKATGRRRSAT